LEAEQILYLARHDPLTGLLNRRHLTERINEEIARVRRTERHFALVMVDIDFFKTFNDAYGHDCGDAVLVKISGAILRSVRKTDSVGRWGGEEFLVLLPETSYHGAERSRKRSAGSGGLGVRHEGKD
jgi:diguanylate cyclase (GGDEF)-like protein